MDHEFSQECEVVGELPEAMNGEFARNGPNPRFRPSGGYHWFDGDGMVSRKRFPPSLRTPLPSAAGVRHGIGGKTACGPYSVVFRKHGIIQTVTKFFRVDDG